MDVISLSDINEKNEYMKVITSGDEVTNIRKYEEDAFGKCLYDYHKGENPFQIIERDDGYIDIIPVNHYFTKHEDWPDHQKEAMDYVHGKVLDVGCGAGKHALYLQNQGFEVIGIDISPLAVKVCRERGLENAKVMDLNHIHKKIKNIDTVLMLGNNFGLFQGKNRAKELLNNIYKVTNDDAAIIAESQDPYETDNEFHLDYHKMNLERGRMAGQLRIRSRYKKYATPWFDYLLVSQDEMKDVLKNTRWSVHKFISSENRYISIIRKKLSLDKA